MNYSAGKAILFIASDVFMQSGKLKPDGSKQTIYWNSIQETTNFSLILNECEYKSKFYLLCQEGSRVAAEYHWYSSSPGQSTKSRKENFYGTN